MSEGGKVTSVYLYANDFSGACNYFSAQVSHLHGGAQLENSKYTKKHNASAMYGCGGGRGHFSGHGWFGGHCGGCSDGQGLTGQILLMVLMY
jgi:hypothetical protein